MGFFFEYSSSPSTQDPKLADFSFCLDICYTLRMNKEEIRKKINSKLPFLREKYNVKRLGIFGSVVRDEQKKGGDVDMLVEFVSPIGYFDFIRLEIFLAETLNQKVDLVSQKALKRIIKDDILKETLYV